MNKTERLLQLISTLGLNKAQFAEAIGVKPQYIYSVLAGTRPLGASLTLKISQTFNVSIDWISNGAGDMFDNNVLNLATNSANTFSQEEYDTIYNQKIILESLLSERDKRIRELEIEVELLRKRYGAAAV